MIPAIAAAAARGARFGTIRHMLTPKKLGKFEQKLGRQLQADRMRIMHKVGKQGVVMLSTLSAHIKDLGTYQRSWRYHAGFRHLRFFNTSRHAPYVEHGRRPGRRPPPVSALRGWCRRKLGNADLAWAVAKKIGKKGIKARPVLKSRAAQRGLRSTLNAAFKANWLHAAKLAKP